jgi:hypothetical protein
MSPTVIVHGTHDGLSTDEVVRRVEGALGTPNKTICSFPGTHGEANPMNRDVRRCIEEFAAKALH